MTRSSTGAGLKPLNGSPKVGPTTAGRAWVPVAALVLLCLAARIPMLSNSPQLPADGHEYLNVARNLAEGRGFRKTIKWNFYRPEPAVHSALDDRPILYPLVLAPVVRWTPVTWLPLALRAFSALMGAAVVLLAYRLWCGWYDPDAALAAACVLAVQPGLLEIGTEPLTETLLLLLLMGVFLAASNARTASRWALVGLLCGLAYLTRPNGALVVPILIVYLVRKEGSGRSAVPLLLGFLTAAAPFWIANARANGGPFVDDLQLAYAVRDVSDATWSGYGRVFQRPGEFIAGHLGYVVPAIDRQLWKMLGTCASSLPFLITFVLFLRRRQLSGLPGALIALAAVNLLFYGLSWTVMGAVRYLLPTTVALIGPLFAAVSDLDLPPLRVGRRIVPPIALLAAAMVIWYSPWIRALYSERAASRTSVPLLDMYRVGGRWLLAQRPDPEAVVLSNNPWQIDYCTHLPAIVCPTFDSPDQVRQFIRQYAVRYIVLFGTTNVGRREATIRAARLPGRFYALPSSVRVWDLAPVGATHERRSIPSTALTRSIVTAVKP